MRATKQLVNGIRVYSRHSADCKKQSWEIKCACPKWIQCQSGGKQVRESAGTRSFGQAVQFAERRAKELSGEAPPRPSTLTVEQAVSNWLLHRTQAGMQNRKAKLMSEKLLAFCRERSVFSLNQITKAHLSDFKLGLKFRSGDSNSLRVHLSVLGGFFRWCVDEAGYIPTNPMPKFKLKWERPEVVVPTTEEINRVLAVESVRLFGSLLRHSGMAIQDAATIERSALVGNLITGRRRKTNEAFRVRVPVWLADELRTLPGDKHFFWDGQIRAESAAENHRLLLRAAFEQAGVNMTPHGFRHYFISSTLATGVSVEDVSHMVGTSPNEIRKTYRHWIKEATDRLDEVQQQAWIKQGLDRNGNSVKPVIQ